MKKIAVLFNTNQLGGAERSLVEQMSLSSQNFEYHLFIPDLEKSDKDLVSFINSHGLNRIHKFSYPGFLYKLSRNDFHKLPFVIFQLPLLIYYLFNWKNIFNSYSDFYVNGNKAIIPLFVLNYFTRKSYSVIWHFRDFPSPRAFGFIGKLTASMPRLKIKLVANSHAVENELKKYFPHHEVQCLYNLAGNLPMSEAPKKISHIGVVSMLAPWKGLHTIMFMAALYDKELKALGVEKISFYGADIYQTAGEHSSYFGQLEKLSQKFPSSLVQFAGKMPPEKIFSEIELLIHSSLQPEPFGRVILEAFKSHIPVISTGLGGAGELIEENVTGKLIIPYDYEGLFKSIKKLSEQPQELKLIADRAYLKCIQIESEIKLNPPL